MVVCSRGCVDAQIVVFAPTTAPPFVLLQENDDAISLGSVDSNVSAGSLDSVSVTPNMCTRSWLYRGADGCRGFPHRWMTTRRTKRTTRNSLRARTTKAACWK